MKKDYTRIVVVLDRSWSMESCKEATITGFNQFVAEQKKLSGTVKLKLVQFDSFQGNLNFQAPNPAQWGQANLGNQAGLAQLNGQLGNANIYNPTITVPTIQPSIVIPTVFVQNPRTNTTQIETTFDAPLSKVPLLGHENFVPRGGTPLFDAVGTVIDQLGDELRSLKESERPERVIVVVITDGEENTSTRYSQEQVAGMVKHQQDKYSWNFIFLGANQDAVLTAAKFNIPQQFAASYNSLSAAATSATYGAISCSVGMLRQGNLQNATFTAQQRAEMMQPDPTAGNVTITSTLGGK